MPKASLEKLAALRARLRRLLEEPQADHRGRLRRLAPVERDLARVVQERLAAAERALMEGDAEGAFLAGVEAAERLMALEGLPDVRSASELEVRDLRAGEVSAKGGHARAVKHHERKAQRQLIVEAHRRWCRDGRRPRDAKRIAESLVQDGWDARSIHTVRKIIGPHLR